jgi:cell division protein ZapA
VSEPVEVRILDRGFTVGVEPAERDSLMQAAAFLDARMREVRGNNRSAALDRVAVLTALNLAAELLQARKAGGAGDQALSRALSEMNRKLDGLFDSLATR